MVCACNKQKCEQKMKFLGKVRVVRKWGKNGIGSDGMAGGGAVTMWW
jgi:hypothetical protein